MRRIRSGLKGSFLLFSCLAIGFFPGVSPAQDTTRTPLAQLVAEAVRVNPNLRVAARNIEKAQAEVARVGYLPDPELMLGVENLPTSFSFREDEMTMKSIGISQMFPFFGKLGTKKNVVRQAVEVARWNYEEQKLELIRQVKETYFELFAQRRSQELTQKAITILSDFVALTRTRYEVGTGLQQDLLMATVEQARLEEKLANLEKRTVAVQNELKSLLDRGPETPDIIPEEVKPVLYTPNRDSLLAGLTETRPMLKMLRADILKAQAEYKAAKREAWPDFTWSVAYGIREGLRTPGMPGQDLDNMVTARLGLNLPINSSRRQGKEAAQASLELANAVSLLTHHAKHDVPLRIDDYLTEIDRNGRLILLYEKTILPQGQLAVQAAQVNYQVGKIDVLTWLSNQLNLLDYQIDYFMTVSEYQKSIARLEAETGVTLQK